MRKGIPIPQIELPWICTERTLQKTDFHSGGKKQKSVLSTSKRFQSLRIGRKEAFYSLSLLFQLLGGQPGTVVVHGYIVKPNFYDLCINTNHIFVSPSTLWISLCINTIHSRYMLCKAPTQVSCHKYQLFPELFALQRFIWVGRAFSLYFIPRPEICSNAGPVYHHCQNTHRGFQLPGLGRGQRTDSHK